MVVRINFINLRQIKKIIKKKKEKKREMEKVDLINQSHISLYLFISGNMSPKKHPLNLIESSSCSLQGQSWIDGVSSKSELDRRHHCTILKTKQQTAQ